MPSQTAATLPTHGPAFLRGLEHVLPTPDGWVAQCPVFGCTELLDITANHGEWLFHCDGDHTHQDVADYLQCDTRQDPITATRAWRALMLATTPDTWQALLNGEPVPRSALDPLWARRLGL